MSNPTFKTKSLVIAGMGAGGMAAALAAVAHGQHVILLDTAPQCGGTVRQTLIHTLGGFYDGDGLLVNPGLSAELLSRLEAASPTTVKRRMGRVWVLNVDPDIYTRVLMDWLRTSSKLQVLPQSQITALQFDTENQQEPQICSVTLKTPEQEYLQPVSAVIDATGHGAVVRQWSAQYVQEGSALAGFIVQIRGVTSDALHFPKNVTLLQRIRKTTAAGQLPPECNTVWLDTGVFPDEVYAKFNLPVTDWQVEHMHSVARHLVQFLQQQPAFSNAVINQYSALGIRDGGQIVGRYCLTETDIKQGRDFIDVAAYGCWPIEHWHATKGIELEYFPAGHRYAIPLRALQVADIQNLWVTGQCISAAPRVRASTRVVGTCWAMGSAVGTHLAKGMQ